MERSYGIEGALWDAAWDGELDKATRLLVEHKANANWRLPEDDTTPLQRAAAKGHTDLVKLLLQHGADPTIKTKGRTAKEMAHKNIQLAHDHGDSAGSARGTATVAAFDEWEQQVAKAKAAGSSMSDAATELNESGAGVVTLADLALDDLRPDDSISMIGGSIGGGGSWLRRLCAGLDGITEAVGRGEAWCDEQGVGSLAELHEVEAAQPGYVEQFVAAMQLKPAKATIVRKRLNDAAVAPLPVAASDARTDVSAFLKDAQNVLRAAEDGEPLE